MAIRVIIKNKLLSRKTVPLEVILGDELKHGKFDVEGIIDGKLGETEFIAYNPKHIGRGFKVIWNKREYKQIELSMFLPCHEKEYFDFTDAAKRIAKYWGGSIIMSGKKLSLAEYSEYAPNLEYNNKLIKDLSAEILSGEYDVNVVQGAFYPLDVGKPEARRFADNPQEFSRWLHEKQNITVAFATPRFYGRDGSDEIFGVYMIYADYDCILPADGPYVPEGYADAQTVEQLKSCKDYRVVLCELGASEAIASMTYGEFYSKIPQSRLSRFDESRVLMKGYSKAEMEKHFK